MGKKRKIVEGNVRKGGCERELGKKIGEKNCWGGERKNRGHPAPRVVGERIKSEELEIRLRLDRLAEIQPVGAGAQALFNCAAIPKIVSVHCVTFVAMCVWGGGKNNVKGS